MGRPECTACDADCELAPTGESIYAYASRLHLTGAELRARIPAGHRATCLACRGVGLADIACESCGKPIAADTLDEEALEYADVLVHRGCDTGHKYFDQPVPYRLGENAFGSRDMRSWR